MIIRDGTRMEQFSRNVVFTAQEGERHDSKWFYERSRGQILYARSRLTAAQSKKFEIEFPRSLEFGKTDLARYEYSSAGLPHVVSNGPQKVFAEFSKAMGEAWKKSDSGYDDLWFKRLIAKAIIYRKVRQEVPKQPWYESGILANIVTYALAKVFNDAGDGKHVLDIDAIWRRQEVSEPLVRALIIAAAEANAVISSPDPGVRLLTEWAKKQACWNWFKMRKLDYDDDFDSCLMLIDEDRRRKGDEKKKNKQDEGINAQNEVVTLGADFWSEVHEWGRQKKLLSPEDLRILRLCSSIGRVPPNEIASKHALKVLGRLRDQGFDGG